MLSVDGIRSVIARNKRWDMIFGIVGVVCLLVGTVTLVTLLADLAIDGVPRLKWHFFANFPSRFPGKAGILSSWVGTLVVMGVTAAAAVPLGVAAGVYLEEYAKKNWFTDLIEINIANLAGVPSIVYGLMALSLFVYQFHLGQSILTAGLTLALMILPIVIISTRESIRAIPQAIREAAYAVGATKWEMVKDHVLPYSLGGTLTGVIIGLSRAIGESAPLVTIGALTFIAFLPPSPVTGSFPFISFEWLKSPFTVLPIQLFNWVSRPQREFHLNAAGAGVVLMFITLSMNALAITLRYRVSYEKNQMVENPMNPMTEKPQTTPALPRPGVPAPRAVPKPADASPAPAKAQVRDLDFAYGPKQVLKKVNLNVLDKRVTALIGPSGCGKTTLLRCFNRMHDLYPGNRYSGEILLQPDNVNIISPHVDPIEVRMRISMVFQKPNPFPKSIYENVAYGLRVRGGLSKSEMDGRVEQALKDAAIWEEAKDRLGELGASLSGGQQQRLCIARALVTDPEILLFDEPTSALDPIATSRVEELVLALKERVTILIVTHNMQQAARVSDFTGFMYVGELVEFDKTDKIFTNPSNKLTEDYITGRFG